MDWMVLLTQQIPSVRYDNTMANPIPCEPVLDNVNSDTRHTISPHTVSYRMRTTLPLPKVVDAILARQKGSETGASRGSWPGSRPLITTFRRSMFGLPSSLSLSLSPSVSRDSSLSGRSISSPRLAVLVSLNIASSLPFSSSPPTPIPSSLPQPA